jgi:hypothetical protein
MDLCLPSFEGIPQVSAHERRSFPRHRYPRKAICQPQGETKDDVWLMGSCQDISLSGLGFRLHRRFDPGTVLTVDLERPTRNSWASFPACVMRCSLQPDGDWILGCAFDPALREEVKELIRGGMKDVG